MRASRYVSYLAAEIEPKAISTLNRFEAEATKVLDKIAAAGARGSAGLATNAMGLGNTRGLDLTKRSAAGASTELQKVTGNARAAGGAANLMAAGFQNAAAALGVVQGPLGPIAGRLGALGNILRTITGYSLAGVLAGGGAFALGNIATQYQAVTDRLSSLYAGQEALNGALNDVVGIAQRTRQGLLPVADLYTSITRAAGNAEISQKRAAAVAETVAKAAQIGGGTQQGKEAALVQFGQALSGDFKTAGQEINSILEQTPALAQALFDGLGVKGVAAFKELAKEGKLSTELIVQALERQGDAIDEAFERRPKRIGQSLTELSNNLSLAIGKIDENLGATSNIAGAISLVANNLDSVVVAAGLVAATFAASSFASAAKGVISYGTAVAAAVQRTLELSRAVSAGNAVVIGSVEANRQRAQFAMQAANVEVIYAKQAATAARDYQQQVRNNIAVLEKQIVTQTKAKETARLIDAAGRSQGGPGNSALVKAETDALNTSTRALALSKQQLAAIDLELAAAEARVAAATAASATTTTASVAADTAAAGSTGRLAGAKVVLAAALAATTRAAASLVAFLGGPWGVAFALAAGVALLLATNTNAAAAAAKQFEGDQASLATTLGFTTSELYKQTDAARALRAELAATGLLKAKQAFGEIQSSAATAIGNKSFAIPFNLNDAGKLQQMRSILLRGQTLSKKGFDELAAIIRKYPQLSNDPAFRDTVIGLKVGNQNFQRAIADAEEVTSALAVPRQKPSPLIAAGGKPETAAQRKARLNRQAAVDGADTGLKKARAELALAKAEGPKAGETDEAYIARIAQMTQAVNGLAGAQRGAGSAAKSAEAARKAEAVAIETASDKADRLAGIIADYTDESPITRLNKIADAAQKAKAKVDDLVGERVEGFKGAFSQADADRIKAQIDATAAARAVQPFTESIQNERERLNLLNLQLTGQGDLVALHTRRLEIEKQMGPLNEDQILQLAKQLELANKLTEAESERNAIIENNAQFLGRVRDAGRDAIRSTLAGDLKGGLKGFAEQIRDAFLDAKANEIAKKLFGDPEKKYRDEMTKGLNRSAEELTDSSVELKAAADALDSAAAAISQSTGAKAAGGGTATIGSLLGDTSDTLSSLDGTIGDLAGAISGQAAGGSSYDDPIIVTGQRRGSAPLPGGVESVIGNLFKSLGGSGGGIGGTGLNGGDIASLASGAIASLFPSKGGDYTGRKFNEAVQPFADLAIQALNTAIPGAGAVVAIANTLSEAIGVKPFAGGLLGIGGSLIAKLFGFGKKKTPSGGAVINSIDGAYRQLGSGESRSNAITIADSVTGGLQNILDALGGQLGTFAVTVGQHDGDYRVNTSGGSLLRAGNPGVFDFNDDAEGAIRFAILDAIQDGAITGIREGSIRLLKAGKDLDAALDKALKFEDVFKRLRRIKDPVGAAVSELNTEFTNLIRIFREAQATTEEWAQLEELYGLERADAIERATSAAVSVLDDFIQGLTSGPESPLSRRTVYDNARAEVDKFRADIAAGKSVDQDDLITALSNYQSASGELFGSRSNFFTDFNDILALAAAARENVPTPTTGDLPASPFDGLDANGNAIVTAVGTTNDILLDILDVLTNPTPTTPTSTGSTIAGLPFSVGAVGGGALSVAGGGGVSTY